MRIEDYDVLVACERSGAVRDALTAVGVRAISCDIHPSDTDGPHYEEDVKQILPLRHWRMLIAHPTCTYLTNAGAKHLYRCVDGVWSVDNGPDEDRWVRMRRGAAFFLLFENADHIPMRAVENPIMHKHAIEIIGRKADQYIQPWWFGDPFAKATGLHLTNLPKLVPEKKKTDYAEIKQKVWFMGPSDDRTEKRSRTEPGIARAFAQQWGHLVNGAAA